MFTEKFLMQVTELALNIAEFQRGERTIQTLPTLALKFDVEQAELNISDIAEDELPDITYYAAVMIAELERRVNETCEKYHVTVSELEAMCLAKYRFRDARNRENTQRRAERLPDLPKDFLLERTLILQARSTVQHNRA